MFTVVFGAGGANKGTDGAAFVSEATPLTSITISLDCFINEYTVLSIIYLQLNMSK